MFIKVIITVWYVCFEFIHAFCVGRWACIINNGFLITVAKMRTSVLLPDTCSQLFPPRERERERERERSEGRGGGRAWGANGPTHFRVGGMPPLPPLFSAGGHSNSPLNPSCTLHVMGSNLPIEFMRMHTFPDNPLQSLLIAIPIACSDFTRIDLRSSTKNVWQVMPL